MFKVKLFKTADDSAEERTFKDRADFYAWWDLSAESHAYNNYTVLEGLA